MLLMGAAIDSLHPDVLEEVCLEGDFELEVRHSTKGFGYGTHPPPWETKEAHNDRPLDTRLC